MIYITQYDVSRVAFRLGQYKKKAPTVIMRALNRASDSARTEVTKQAMENYFVPSGEVRKTIKITRATRDQLQAIITSKATRRELIAFKVSPKNPRHKNPPKVLKVAVKKEGGLKELLGAFVAKGVSTGKPHVLKRTSEERYPIHIKYGPSVPEMIGTNLKNRGFKTLIEKKVQEIYERRLDHEIKRVLEGGS